MGKWKHRKVTKSARHQPLIQQIEASTYAQPTKRNKKSKDEEEKGKDAIDWKIGKRILTEAKKQRDDLEKELVDDSVVGLDETLACVGLGKIKIRDELQVEEQLEDGELENQDALLKSLKISEDDEKMLESSKKGGKSNNKTLNEYVLEKLKEKDDDQQSELSDLTSVKLQDLDEKIIELYRGVKTVLSRYRSGKIPKAFKVIPALSNWEQILALTDPDHWTSAAMLQATRLFTANLKERMAQRFFCLILLPRIRDEIAEYKRLNVHLYQALKKALFKPGAFYKGIVLPLCHDEECTLREAAIISSLLTKSSVPILHSCAAMLKIAEMDYKGPNSIFLLTLLRKKYALPYRVIDALVCHFARFSADTSEFPVLWYQALLAFVENYHTDISDEQKEALADLCKVHRHHQITPVIMNYLHPVNKMQE